MIAPSRLDGAVPSDPGASRDAAVAALTRRVVELERRLNVMKVVIGLVLAAKVLVVAMVVYVLLETGIVVRSGGPTQQIGATTRRA